MAERRSALIACLEPGHHGAVHSAGPGVELREVAPLAIVQVAAFEMESARSELRAAIGVAPTEKRNEVAGIDETRVLWTGPGRWLVIEPETRDLHRLLAQGALASVAAVTDLSHARTAIALAGPASRAVLAKLCSIDVDPAVFRSGACAQTQFGQIGALVHCRAAQSFEILVFRGFAVSAWEMILDAALEFGCHVG